MQLLEILRNIEKLEIGKIEVPMSGINRIDIDKQDITIEHGNTTISTITKEVNVVIK